MLTCVEGRAPPKTPPGQAIQVPAEHRGSWFVRGQNSCRHPIKSRGQSRTGQAGDPGVRSVGLGAGHGYPGSFGPSPTPRRALFLPILLLGKRSSGSSSVGRAGLRGSLQSWMSKEGEGWDGTILAKLQISHLLKTEKKQKQNKNPGWDEDMGARQLLGTLLWVMVTKHRVRLPHLKSLSTLELN